MFSSFSADITGPRTFLFIIEDLVISLPPSSRNIEAEGFESESYELLVYHLFSSGSEKQFNQADSTNAFYITRPEIERSKSNLPPFCINDFREQSKYSHTRHSFQLFLLFFLFPSLFLDKSFQVS